MGAALRKCNGFEKPHRKGFVSELKACLWLYENGYEVFYNVAPNGKIDMVMWNEEEDEFIKIDVKTATAHVNKKTGVEYYSIAKLKKDQIQKQIRPLAVLPNGTCLFPDNYRFNENGYEYVP